MKKIALILILVLSFILVFKPGFVYAWDDCVFGKINDEYPGDCARYIDTDNDGICDHSQPTPEDRDSSQPPEQKNLVPKEQPVIKKTNDYYLAKLAMTLLLIYGASFLLTKLGKISIVQHRRFWNIGLTLSFLVNGLSGILLALNIAYGININLPFKTLFWHVETGIVFTMLAFFHLVWHLPYYKSLFK